MARRFGGHDLFKQNHERYVHDGNVEGKEGCPPAIGSRPRGKRSIMTFIIGRK